MGFVTDVSVVIIGEVTSVGVPGDFIVAWLKGTLKFVVTLVIVIGHNEGNVLKVPNPQSGRGTHFKLKGRVTTSVASVTSKIYSVNVKDCDEIFVICGIIVGTVAD